MKIKFEPLSDSSIVLDNSPVSALKTIPHWYKKIDPYFTSDKKDRIFEGFGGSSTNTTVKACMPFLDAMTFGYIVKISSDIEFSISNNNQLDIRWRTPYAEILESHAKEVTNGIPVEHNATNEILKWIFDWKIITPKGYSCLYTHPFNRHDLPFRTFTGVVDTDIYPDSVHFPFQLLELKTNYFILEKGTPICQIIPFKRDNWDSEILKFTKYNKEKYVHQVVSKIVRSYKKQFWQKKIFK